MIQGVREEDELRETIYERRKTGEEKVEGTRF